KDITIQSTNPNDPNIVAATIIDGYNLDATVNFDGSEDSDTVLSGLTITGTRSRPEVHLTFDETTGAVAYDSTLYQRDGDLTNMTGTEWTTGQIGNALDFDGNEDYVKITGYKGISDGASRTTTAWIKTTSGGKIIFWGKIETAGKWIMMIDPSNGALRIAISGGNIIGSTDLTDGQWHHVAAVLEDDGLPDANEIKLYVDGAKEIISSSSSCRVTTVLDADVRVGCDIDG
ncbi:MAG: LamG domain-containing protein, partial [Planctomycetes bacterium]|nr:LamG domain-containing protein [Planctomycetota bacterium]